jgi:hypothetical protein
MHADTLTTVLHLARALLEGGGAGRLVDRVRAEQLALEAYEGFGTLHRQQPEHSDIADAKELLSRLRADGGGGGGGDVAGSSADAPPTFLRPHKQVILHCDGTSIVTDASPSCVLSNGARQ